MGVGITAVVSLDVVGPQKFAIAGSHAHGPAARRGYINTSIPDF